MFNIKSLIGAQSYLGVDIGTTSIKIAEISKGKKHPKLQNYGILENCGHLERLNDAIQTSGLKIAEKETAELLKLLLEKSKIKSKEALASISSFSAFVTLLKIPEMSEIDMEKTMPFQIKQQIPLPLQEVAIEWLKVGEKESQSGISEQQILVISIPNEIILRYRNIFKLAGLKLRVLEMESLSLIRALIADKAPTLLVDIGGCSTNIAVVENGFLKYSIHTNFAGGSLTRAIANGLNIDVKRAEELKKYKGIASDKGEYELSTLTFLFLDALINEIKRVKTLYEKDQLSKIEKIILAGGGANLLGIKKYFEEQINLPITIGDPFLKIEIPVKIEPLIKELGPGLSVAIGLGIKEFIL